MREKKDERRKGMRIQNEIKKIIPQILEGKTIVLHGNPGRYSGKYWKVWKRPPYMCFRGEQQFEISPSWKGKTYLFTIGKAGETYIWEI